MTSEETAGLPSASAVITGATGADAQGGSEGLSAVFVTASSAEEAKRLSVGLLSGGLAACVTQIPQVTSMYMWEGKMEESTEVMMMIKVTKPYGQLFLVLWIAFDVGIHVCVVCRSR